MSSPKSTYHHGDLHRALIDAAADLLSERGAGGFSLREVARRAGVSHAAPAHHFGDATGLLTAVAAEGFQHLHTAMIESMEGVSDPVDRLAAIARAYVEMAIAHPGHSSLMGRHDLVSPDSQLLREWSTRAYESLHEAVAAVAEEVNPEVDIDNATRLCWAMVEGLLQVHDNMTAMAEASGADTPLPTIGDVAEVFSNLIVDGIRGSDSA